MKKTTNKYFCDFCGKEIIEDLIQMEPYPYEGASEIKYNGKSFFSDEKEYCSFECLKKDIERTLTGKAVKE